MFLLKSHPFNAFFSAFSSRSLREGKKMHLLIRVFFLQLYQIIGISDCMAPFTVGIHTVATTDPDFATSMGANGVCLNYSQRPC